jgi:hypothetical protein
LNQRSNGDFDGDMATLEMFREPAFAPRKLAAHLRSG